MFYRIPTTPATPKLQAEIRLQNFLAKKANVRLVKIYRAWTLFCHSLLVVPVFVGIASLLYYGIVYPIVADRAASVLGLLSLAVILFLVISLALVILCALVYVLIDASLWVWNFLPWTKESHSLLSSAKVAHQTLANLQEDIVRERQFASEFVDVPPPSWSPNPPSS